MTTDDLVNGLERAAIWLRGYETSHKAKGTHDGDTKAITNAARAAELEDLVARWRNLHP